MQPKPAPPTMQLTLPFEIPRRAGHPPQEEMEEALVGRCAPEETWQMLGPSGRDRLRRTWICVLKEVANDAQER